MNKQTAQAAPTVLGFILNCLTASLVSVAIMTIFLGISAVVLNVFQDPESLYGVFSTSAYIITAVICGIIAKRKNGYSALFCGLLSAGFMALILLTVSFILPEFRGNSPVWQPALLVLGAIIGAFISK